MKPILKCTGTITRDKNVKEVNKKPAAFSSMAVIVTGEGAGATLQHMQLGLVGFGEHAEALGSLKRGNQVNVSGVLSKRPYVDKANQRHDGYSLLLESIEVVI